MLLSQNVPALKHISPKIIFTYKAERERGFRERERVREMGVERERSRPRERES
jgi:hypothetical protein